MAFINASGMLWLEPNPDIDTQRRVIVLHMYFDFKTVCT